jgi:hypothetical protein
MFMHGPAFNKIFAYKEFHEAIDVPERPSNVLEAPEGLVFVAVTRYEAREEAIRVSSDEILSGVPEENTVWLMMPVDKAEKLVHPV